MKIRRVACIPAHAGSVGHGPQASSAAAWIANQIATVEALTPPCFANPARDQSFANMRTTIGRALALAAFLALFLGGCKFTMPHVSSARVEQHEGRVLRARELDYDQVRELSAWFSRHASGWSSSVASYAPTLVVRAKHSDDTSVVNIMPGRVVVYSRHGQYEQKFSQDELGALREILGVR